MPVEGLDAIVDSVMAQEGVAADTPVAAPDQTPSVTPPAPAAKPEVPETAAPEAPAAAPEDPEVDIPGIGKVKASEVAAWKQGNLMQADYTRKTQELAEQRAQVAARQAAFELQQSQVQAQVQQQQQAESMRLHPLVNPNNWVQARTQMYIDQGWNPNDPGHAHALNQMIQRDLYNAQMQATQENHAAIVRELQRRDQVSQQQAMEAQRGQAIDAELAKPEHASIRNDDGRNVVRAFLARAQVEGKPVDVAAAVAAASGLVNKMLAGYVKTKTQQAASTGPILRGGGGPKAPEPRAIKGTSQELYDWAEEAAKGESQG